MRKTEARGKRSGAKRRRKGGGDWGLGGVTQEGNGEGEGSGRGLHG